MDELRATNVEERDEGPKYKTSDPELWVLMGDDDDALDAARKTEPQMNTLSPEWPEVLCVSTTPRADPRTCFQIRDDYDPAYPEDRPPLLHEGCALLNASSDWWAPHTLRLSGGAVLTFRVHPRWEPTPPPPPLPPVPPPSPPAAPLDEDTSVCGRINKRFRDGKPSNDLAAAGVLIHQVRASCIWTCARVTVTTTALTPLTRARLLCTRLSCARAVRLSR